MTYLQEKISSTFVPIYLVSFWDSLKLFVQLTTIHIKYGGNGYWGILFQFDRWTVCWRLLIIAGPTIKDLNRGLHRIISYDFLYHLFTVFFFISLDKEKETFISYCHNFWMTSSCLFFYIKKTTKLVIKVLKY